MQKGHSEGHSRGEGKKGKWRGCQNKIRVKCVCVGGGGAGGKDVFFFKLG